MGYWPRFPGHILGTFKGPWQMMWPLFYLLYRKELNRGRIHTHTHPCTRPHPQCHQTFGVLSFRRGEENSPVNVHVPLVRTPNRLASRVPRGSSGANVTLLSLARFVGAVSEMPGLKALWQYRLPLRYKRLFMMKSLQNIPYVYLFYLTVSNVPYCLLRNGWILRALFSLMWFFCSKNVFWSKKKNCSK